MKFIYLTAVLAFFTHLGYILTEIVVSHKDFVVTMYLLDVEQQQQVLEANFFEENFTRKMALVKDDLSNYYEIFPEAKEEE